METVVGVFPKSSNGKKIEPIHGILYSIVEPIEKVKKKTMT